MNNPVRSEYIILEPTTGVQLTDVWDDMSEHNRVKLIRGFAQSESKLAALNFPGYGALYLREALPPSLRKPGRRIDVDNTYSIGPFFHGSWPGGYAANIDEYSQYAGPWRTLADLGLDLARQGLWQIEHSKASYGGRGPHFGTPEEHRTILHITMEAIPLLAECPLLKRHSQPVLCHPDFHPGNVFVEKDDHTKLSGIIDWQYTVIMPRFTQVRWPLFLNPPSGYQKGMSNPELPPNFNGGEEEQEVITEEPVTAPQERQRQALLTKCYEAALVKTHLESYQALTEIDVALRDVFTMCPYTHREGIVPLRDCLVRLYRQWPRLGLREKCPYKFSDVEVAQHQRELSEYREWLNLRKYILDLLQANEGGWLSPKTDFEEAQKKHRILYDKFIRDQSKSMPVAEAKKLWFLRDRG